MDFDAERLARNRQDLAAAKAEIDRLTRDEADAFLADTRSRLALRYVLIQAVEGIVDICQHVLSRAAGVACQGYVDCIVKAGEHGIIDEPLAGKLRKLASLRNGLVHRYWQIDDRRVYESCREDAADLDAFLAQIERYIRSR